MNTRKKIITLEALKRKTVELRRQGKIIAFTNGCFDILHAGHVRYLEQAHHGSRVLIVGLNSDSSIREIKGPQRPVVPEKARAAVLAALACVDYVTIFDEETPARVIGVLKPDVLIKGADWKGKEVAGSDIVRRYGGRVEYIPYVPGFSTTRMIQTIYRRQAG